MRGKYGYFYDRLRNEDVFFLSTERLNDIDRSRDGVVTNSLAVKILERLSSYYFTADWDDRIPRHHRRMTRSASVNAHNLSNRFDDPCAVFVGKLVGIFANNTFQTDQIIQLKLLFPDQPIYIGMDYGREDGYGRKHDRHGLRVDQIIPDRTSPGGYRFMLVNPWNTERGVEEYSVNDIKQRGSRFCIYKTNPQRFELMQRLAMSPDVLKTVVKIKKLKPSFDSNDIHYCLMIHQQRPDLLAVFSSLKPLDQQSLIQYIVSAKSEMERLTRHEMLYLFADKINEIQLDARRRPTIDTNACIASCANRINTFPVSFTAILSHQRIDDYIQQLLLRLRSNLQQDPELTAAEHALGIAAGRHHQMIVQALSIKTEAILALAEQQRLNIKRAQELEAHCVRQIETFPVSFDSLPSDQRVDHQCMILCTQLNHFVDSCPELSEAASLLGLHRRQFRSIAQAISTKTFEIENGAMEAKKHLSASLEAKHVLVHNNFIRQLDRLTHETNELQMMATTDGSLAYRATLAVDLHTALERAKITFLGSSKTKTERLNEFKLTCVQVIREALPLLDDLFDLKKSIESLRDIVLSMSSMHLSTAPFRLFSRPVEFVDQRLRSQPSGRTFWTYHE